MLGIWGNSTLNSLPVLQARLPDTLRFWEVDILYTVGAGAEKTLKGELGNKEQHLSQIYDNNYL